MRRTALLLILFPALLAACNGNIGDIFDIYPTRVFDPDGGDGGDGGLPPTGIEATEVGFIEAAQGVDGDVRNIALAQSGAQIIAFLSAGTSGVHVVDVTEPARVNSKYITTIEDAVLSDPLASLAGGRSDNLAVVDNTYLVTIAVDSGAADAVSVFHIPTILALATTPSSDLSNAFVPKLGGPDIAVPGFDGKGGGVSGRAGAFVVATGGPTLGVGGILPGTPGTWAASDPFDPATLDVEHFNDVLFALNGVFASVHLGETYGLIALVLTGGTPPTVTLLTPDPIQTENPAKGDDYDVLLARNIVGRGSIVNDLALDGNTLFVSGDEDVLLFNVSNPALTTPPGIADRTGRDTIAVSANGGFFAVGAGDLVNVYSVLTGQAVLTATHSVTGVNMIVRGVAMTSDINGRYVLCCAGQRGLRSVQWSNVP